MTHSRLVPATTRAALLLVVFALAVTSCSGNSSKLTASPPASSTSAPATTAAPPPSVALSPLTTVAPTTTKPVTTAPTVRSTAPTQPSVAPTTTGATTSTTAPCPYPGAHPQVAAGAPPYPHSNGNAHVAINGTCFGPDSSQTHDGQGQWGPVSWVIDGVDSSGAGATKVPAGGSFSYVLDFDDRQCGHHTVQAHQIEFIPDGTTRMTLSNTITVTPC